MREEGEGERETQHNKNSNCVSLLELSRTRGPCPEVDEDYYKVSDVHDDILKASVHIPAQKLEP